MRENSISILLCECGSNTFERIDISILSITPDNTYAPHVSESIWRCVGCSKIVPLPNKTDRPTTNYIYLRLQQFMTKVREIVVDANVISGRLKPSIKRT